MKDIHLQNKKDVGIRIANYALTQTYQQHIGAYKSPLYKNMEIQNNKIVLFFDNAAQGFTTKDGKKPDDFFIASADQNFFRLR